MRITLKAARINRGLTQEALSHELGVTKKTVGSWESGKTMPGVDKIEQLCSILEISYDNIQWRV